MSLQILIWERLILSRHWWKRGQVERTSGKIGSSLFRSINFPTWPFYGKFTGCIIDFGSTKFFVDLLPSTAFNEKMFRPQSALTLLCRRTLTSTSLSSHSYRIFALPSLSINLATNYTHLQSRCKSTEPNSVPPFIESGDWMCGNCQAHNFSKRMLCFECQTVITNSRVFYKAGAWHCPTCNLSVPRTFPITNQCWFQPVKIIV